MFPLKGESKNIEAYFGMLFFYATKLRNVTNTKWYLLQMENIAKRNRVSPFGEELKSDANFFRIRIDVDLVNEKFFNSPIYI